MPAETFSPEVRSHRKRKETRDGFAREKRNGSHERVEVRKSGRRKIGAGIMRLLDRMHSAGFESSRHVNAGDKAAPAKPLAHSEDLAGLRRQLETYRIPEQPAPREAATGQNPPVPEFTPFLVPDRSEADQAAGRAVAAQEATVELPTSGFDDPELAALHNRENTNVFGDPTPGWATEHQGWYPAVTTGESPVAERVADDFAENFQTSDDFEPQTGRHHMNRMFTPAGEQESTNTEYKARHAAPDQAPDFRTDPLGHIDYINNPMHWVNLRRGK